MKSNKVYSMENVNVVVDKINEKSNVKIVADLGSAFLKTDIIDNSIWVNNLELVIFDEHGRDFLAINLFDDIKFIEIIEGESSVEIKSNHDEITFSW